MDGGGVQAFWTPDLHIDARGCEALRPATGAKERATKGEEIMARRKTFQQGTVVERKYEYGTAFILRYRIAPLYTGAESRLDTRYMPCNAQYFRARAFFLVKGGNPNKW